jgi:hypothetical protein
VTDREYYPDFISLRVDHGAGVTPVTLASEYARCFRDAAFGAIVGYSIAGMDGKVVRGGLQDLETAIARLPIDDAHFFKLVFKDETSLVCSRKERRQVWEAEAQHPLDQRPTAQWMSRVAKVGMNAPRLPQFQFAVLRRKQGSWVDFVPDPPLARANHLVTVTDEEVGGAYEDPDFFWSVWDSVERVGNQHVCVRALDDLDDRDWLARTFEQTMELVRRAKAIQTIYHEPRWVPGFSPWWEYGDVQDEKAGYPALSLAGYDARTKTVELTGFVTKRPIEEGGEEPRHVLVREVHDLRALVASKRDAKGRPVATVRIVFLEEWMARQERRPLLDTGAKVFYPDRKTGKDIEVRD